MTDHRSHPANALRTVAAELTALDNADRRRIEARAHIRRAFFDHDANAIWSHLASAYRLLTEAADDIEIAITAARGVPLQLPPRPVPPAGEPVDDDGEGLG
ncbi:hypothetical protein [Geodermatophilus sp. URMC 62]|uniref:hypothetical protein n=1 Tax=Geodermatophilus sp. URMC 62 TaxID=3423414 RepID=UPI00406C5A0A